ncbi:MAG: winged helix-turn-helix transcriptional regulator [Desulfatibacillum sp.]|nr:winged helix-turn-helix transcriptional regulator [Desulfatibacillum sp.]
MKNTSPTPFSLIGKFVRVIKTWQALEKQPRKFGLDVDLHSSEIHLVEAVGHNEDMCVTDLADLMGVTKGAVSQTLKKLENKRLVAKIPDPANSSRVLVQLTAKGKVAFYAHQHWHETMDGGFKEYLFGMPQDKLIFLDEFLDKLLLFFTVSR